MEYDDGDDLLSGLKIVSRVLGRTAISINQFDAVFFCNFVESGLYYDK